MTLRIVVIIAILSVLSVAWMHQASLVQAPGIIYAPVYLLSVPPVPAIFALMLLVALAPLSGRLMRRTLSKQELVLAYMLLCIVVPPVTFGLIELLIPWVTSGIYLDAPGNDMRALSEALPAWFYPHDDEVIRQMFEGSEDGSVPWGPWLYPLAMWTVWLTLIFGTFMCMVCLFHRQWSEHERLRYPLLFIPLSVVEREAPGSHTAFFRNPLVWIGISIVVIHHLMNIANAYNPVVMALKDRYNLGQAIFTEYPWTAFRGLTIFHRPQVIGLAYLVPLDILFSGWFFFVMQSVLVFVSDVFGLTAARGFPWSMSQSAGGHVAMMLVTFWVARHELARIAARALSAGPIEEDADQPLPYRIALPGLIVGFSVLVIWTRNMGVPLGHALGFLLIFFASGFVFARLRSEAGIPSMWGPAPYHVESVFEFTGTRTLTAGGRLAGLSVLRVYNWLARSFLGTMSAYQAENNRLADEVGIRNRIMPPAMMITFVLGCVLAYIFILQAYYTYGAMVLHGGQASGGYNVVCAWSSWKQANTAVTSPADPNPGAMIAGIGGGLLVIAMVILRWRWLRVPLHPLGYVSCIWYGYALWFPFMATWAIKWLVHRLGGARLYRQLMPFFLGLAFGDLLAGGISWIVMGLFGPDVFNGYMVQFG